MFEILLNESKMHLGSYITTFGLDFFPYSLCINKTKKIVGSNLERTTKFIPTFANAKL
jgi:hypothetical protein